MESERRHRLGARDLPTAAHAALRLVIDAPIIRVVCGLVCAWKRVRVHRSDLLS